MQTLYRNAPYILILMTPLAIFANISYVIPNPVERVATTLFGFIQQVLNLVVLVGVPVLVIYIVWAGVKFVLAQGNDQKLTQAKGALTWAVIGGALLLGAWVLAQAIEGTIRAL